MTFWDHLEELRGSLIRVMSVLVGVTVVLFFFKDFLFSDIILAPVENSFFLYRLLGVSFSLPLVNLEVAAQFMIHMKVTFVCAAIITFPYLIYEIWKFISPALYENEKRVARRIFAYASGLFYAGLAVGYCLVFPLMLNFFAGYHVSPDVPNTFSLSSYISMFMSTVFMFGIVFEFPSVIAGMSMMGIVSKSSMKSLRKYAFCAVLILAAVITPSGDPFSMLVVSLPLYLLYELSILMCRKGDRQVV